MANDLGNIDERESRVRARILTVAAEIFERRGVRRTTMEEIAEAAGVARKTVYNYFENKPKLLGDVIEEASARTAAAALASLDLTAPPEDLIVDAAIVQLQHARHSTYSEMLLRPDALPITAKTVEQSERISRVQRGFWAPILEPLRDAGRLRVTDLDEVVEWLTFIHLVFLTRPATFEGDLDVTRRMLRTYLVPALLHPTESAYAHRGDR
ncbi:TetR/AcrR family transcriptional regulator [Mycolicibacterium holsaticum]|uniref:TetR/AcrR family transcriptional regulator n=1 Tax=Mycolicibacterium holsaticum TaxID=152142 RepID=UPI000ADED0F3|nr:TetR/AcrR family transcriptional regulator [Mycolicibacterium holsaticum]